MSEEAIQKIMRLHDDIAAEIRVTGFSAYSTKRRAALEAAVRKAVRAARPPVQPTEWNAAIEAAEEVVARMVQGVDMAPTVRAIRRLKREHPPVQPTEPVGLFAQQPDGEWIQDDGDEKSIPLYAHPPALSEAFIQEALRLAHGCMYFTALEAHLRSKG